MKQIFGSRKTIALFFLFLPILNCSPTTSSSKEKHEEFKNEVSCNTIGT